MNKKRAKHKKSHLKAGGFIKNLDGRRMRRFAPRTARKLFNSSLSLTAYPSYQVPFRGAQGAFPARQTSLYHCREREFLQ